MCALLSLAGCSGLWDEITSSDFNIKTLFVEPDPLVVLHESTDGDKRARALRDLKEPNLSGGTQADQDEIIKILTAAAVSDKQPVCRLSAMQTLARFKDPHVVEILSDAFYKANGFAPDTTTMLRCHALKALGEVGSPQAIELLVRVVREPQSEGTALERQNALDVRLAAARALAHYKEPRTEAVLIQVMRNEKDVGLRMCAYASLKTATGKNLPLESPEWDATLQLAGVSPDAPESPTTVKPVSAPAPTPTSPYGTIQPAALSSPQ
jgi:PBS lyase HEAT-like repeat